jgi:ABC-2 type transport system permease protein
VKTWIPFFAILSKDMKAYYLKPPNVSWGLIFPLAWTGMFFIRSGGGIDGIMQLLPGVSALSILFGTTSMLAVTVTFEKKNRSFDRLLLSPIPLETLMLAKTSGAIMFGVANAIVPVLMATLFIDVSGVNWPLFAAAAILVAVVSAFLGLFVAVAVNEVFEAQTFSNFIRFPMVFLCGLFFPVHGLPVFLRPLSYALPLTYGADLLRRAILGAGMMSPWMNIGVLTGFCTVLFLLTVKNVRRRWIS